MRTKEITTNWNSGSLKIEIENFEINEFLAHEYLIDQLNRRNEVYPSWRDKPEVAYVCPKFATNPFGKNSLFRAIADVG